MAERWSSIFQKQKGAALFRVDSSCVALLKNYLFDRRTLEKEREHHARKKPIDIPQCVCNMGVVSTTR